MRPFSSGSSHCARCGETVRGIGALGQKEVPQSLPSRDVFEFLDDRRQMVRCALLGERPPLLSVGGLSGINVGVHEGGDPREVLAGSCARSEIHVIPSSRCCVCFWAEVFTCDRGR